jgi:hypothetical protein
VQRLNGIQGLRDHHIALDANGLQGRTAFAVYHPAASSPMEATSQKRSNSDTSGSLQEPRIDMRRVTGEIYENAPPQYCLIDVNYSFRPGTLIVTHQLLFFYP